jgi:hypothetical protein
VCNTHCVHHTHCTTCRTRVDLNLGVPPDKPVLGASIEWGGANNTSTPQQFCNSECNSHATIDATDDATVAQSLLQVWIDLLQV